MKHLLANDIKSAKLIFLSVFALYLYANCQLAAAHKASDSYLALKVSDDLIIGQWDIALRDLDYAIELDTNSDGVITWGELRNKQPFVYAYAFEHLELKSGNSAACLIIPMQYQVDSHTDGAYAVLTFQAACPEQINNLGIQYALFFDLDPQHRGLLRVESGQNSHTAILSPTQSHQQIELGVMQPGTAFLQYLHEGVWHIWTGYDHILFLMSLLLPVIFTGTHYNQWQPATQFRPVWIEVVKIVTAFTIAHSLTLSLATLQVISLPSRWVESAIAISVILAALNNLYPIIHKKIWLVAFGFGLIHGLGFANVLKDLGLPPNMLLLTLLAFNLGVELGQLAIVAVFLPVAYVNRQRRWYRYICFNLGSAVIVMIAGIWFVERAFNLKLLN